jgi:hypothetical protein
MSFDIFLFPFERGEKGRFDGGIAERAFARLIDFRDGNQWSLTVPDWGPCSGRVLLHLIDDGPAIDCLSINRPPCVPALFDALFEVMRQTPTLLVWPGSSEDPTACYANSAVPAEAPEGVLISFKAVHVGSGAEIERILC